MSKGTLGLLVALLGPVCWSIGGVLVRLIPFEPWTIVSGRSLALALIMAAVVTWRTGGRPWEAALSLGWRGLLAGLCLCGAFVFYILAVSTTTIAGALALQATSPAFAALIAYLLMGERPSRPRLLAIGVVLMAVVGMLAAAPPGNLTGEISGVLCGVSFAGAIVLVRAAGGRDSYAMMCWAGVISAAVALPLAQDLGRIGGREVLIFLALGGVQLALGFACFTWGAARIPAAQAALVALLENVLGPLWVFLVVAETPDLPTMIGLAVILCAVMFDTVAAGGETARGRASTGARRA